MANKLKVGDTIKCNSKEEMVSMSEALASENIITDFLYEKDGEEGFWLVVTDVAPAQDLSVAEIKQKMCDDYCRYPREYPTGGEIMDDVICANCPLNYLED